MTGIARFLVFMAVFSLLGGIVFKLLGLDLTSVFSAYPFQPRSFLNFADTLLLLAIAMLLFPRNNE